MVYLKPDTSEAARLDTKFKLQSISSVREARFISRDEAMEKLKNQMAHHAALLDNLKANPLPDAFEVSLRPSAQKSAELSFLAERIAALATVSEVEYGQQWIHRFNRHYQPLSTGRIRYRYVVFHGHGIHRGQHHSSGALLQA